MLGRRGTRRPHLLTADAPRLAVAHAAGLHRPRDVGAATRLGERERTSGPAVDQRLCELVVRGRAPEGPEDLRHRVVRDGERRHRRRPGRQLLDDDQLVAHVTAAARAWWRTHRERPEIGEGDEELVVELLGGVERGDSGWRRHVGDEASHGGPELGPLRAVGDRVKVHTVPAERNLRGPAVCGAGSGGFA